MPAILPPSFPGLFPADRYKPDGETEDQEANEDGDDEHGGLFAGGPCGPGVGLGLQFLAGEEGWREERVGGGQRGGHGGGCCVGQALMAGVGVDTVEGWSGWMVKLGSN